MNDTIVYVDQSVLRPGASADALRRAVDGLVRFVEAREPQLLDYACYVDDVAREMTVVAVHPDSASLALHLAIGGPEFRKVGEFIELRRIDVYGRPGEDVVRMLHAKAAMLGRGATVVVHEAASGFSRASGPAPGLHPEAR